RLGALVLVPQLGGHEQLVAGDAGGGDGAADALLVLVDRRGVDMAVSDLEGVGHHPLGLVGLDEEDTEAELRDLVAVVERDRGNGHGHHAGTVCCAVVVIATERGRRTRPACPRASRPRPRHADPRRWQMARAIWSGALAFGLVNVPVGMYSATEDRTIHFRQFEKGTSSRIRYRRINEDTG